MISEEQFQKQLRIVRHAEAVFYSALRNTQALIQRTGWGYQDIRISMFGKLSGILNSAVVSLYFLQNHLTHRDWWLEVYGDNFKVFEASVPQTITCFDGQAKTALILGVVSNAESSFRILLEHFDPKACAGATAAFANIYDCLLRKTDCSGTKIVFDMLRLLRNTQLHSDGIFQPINGKDAHVTYRGMEYHFVVGKPLRGVTWELALNLSEDALDLMLKVVSSPISTAFSLILDAKKVEQQEE